MAKLRRRLKQTMSLQERLAIFAKAARDKSSALPPGDEQQRLLRKVRQADTACHFDGLISSSGQLPK